MAQTKKVILISYFFPPCNLTGGRRAQHWAKGLKEEGIYPIVITRSWEHPIRDFLDMSLKSGDQDTVEQHDGYEVHALQHKGNFKDRFVQRFGAKLSFIRKGLSLLELFLQNFHPLLSPYANFYRKAKELIETDAEITHVIITGMPFHQFSIGYKLKQKYPHIKWIADYRDEWTSRPNFERTRSNNLFIRWDTKYERKWLSNADHFTYVDAFYLERIRKHINHPSGHAILNGYQPEEDFKHAPEKGSLMLTFPGSLYSHQNITFFAESLLSFHQKHPEIPVQVNFIGSGINVGIEDKIRSAFAGLEAMLNITPRIGEKELREKYLVKSHALLMFPLKDMNQAVPTKIISNFPLGIPYIFTPTDHGAIPELIEAVGMGIATDNEQGLHAYLLQLSQKGSMVFDTEHPRIKVYSRREQIHKLAALIKE